jgi:hypothetical protein
MKRSGKSGPVPPCGAALFYHVRDHCGVVARRRENAATAAAARGYIVSSGQSYHFYGSDLLRTDQLVTMFAKALLYAPIVDRAWAAL